MSEIDKLKEFCGNKHDFSAVHLVILVKEGKVCVRFFYDRVEAAEDAKNLTDSKEAATAYVVELIVDKTKLM